MSKKMLAYVTHDNVIQQEVSFSNTLVCLFVCLFAGIINESFGERKVQ